MSGQLRALRNRIRSVENTKKITRAMEMVAAAKLRRFQDMMQKSRAYTLGLETLLKRVSSGEIKNPHPFIKPQGKSAESNSAASGKTALVLITSDTGLCGSYNTDLVHMAQRFISEQKTKPVLIGVGKSGVTAFKKSLPCRASFIDVRASRFEEILAELRQTLEKMYLENEVDSVYVAYSHFKNVTTFKATVEKILPFQAPHLNPPPAQAGGGTEGDSEDYIFEPSPEILFQKLIPQFFEAKVRLIFLEAIVSEQIARMTAMNQATKNAKEMIDSLVLQRNKARQAAITKELIEIVSGSQALKLK